MTTNAAGPGNLLGPYRLVRELGRGGMGVVYEALRLPAGDRVALKVLAQAPSADAGAARQDEERFLQEARLSMGLPAHPGIVRVFDSGTDQGRPYLAMDLVEGRPFSEWRKDPASDLQRQIRVLRDAARAVHEAHEHGVVHRDLKPQNLLVDAEGRPHLTDFGLAKTLGRDLSLSLTGAGLVIGTPGYISPEMAEGIRRVDRRADVYALGVLLFETLTGRLPFPGDTAVEMLVRMVKDPAPAPSSVARAVRRLPRGRDLELVCRQALARDPEERTPTAKEYADDLDRWLSGERVRARLPRELRGNPVSWMLAAAGLLVAAGLGWTTFAGGVPAAKELERADRLMRERQYAEAMLQYGVVLARDSGNARALAGQQEALAAQKLEQARLIEGAARAAAERAGREAEDRRRAEALESAEGERARQSQGRLAAEERARQAEEALKRAQAELQAAMVKRPLTPAPPAEPPRVPVPLKIFTGHAGDVKSAALSPDGAWALSAGADATARLWELPSGRAGPVFRGHSEMVRFAAFSPDGRLVATASQDRTIRLWDSASGRELRKLEGHSNMVRALAFSPDGRSLLSSSWDRTLKIWELPGGALRATLQGHGDLVKGVVYSPDGRWIASAGGPDLTVRLWEASSGRELRVLKGASGSVEAVLFTASGGELLASGHDGVLRVWDPASGRELRRRTIHAEPVETLALSPDGQRLASGGWDRSIRLWDWPALAERGSAGRHDGHVLGLVFTADGKRLVSAGHDGTVRLWDVPAP